MNTLAMFCAALSCATVCLAAAPALAHPHDDHDEEVEPVAEDTPHGDDLDDGAHHHHPHAHPSPRRPQPSGYDYRYGPSGAYRGPAGGSYQRIPRVIEGWEPGDPVPDGYRPDTQSHRGLVKGGAATLFSVYGLTAIVGSFMVFAEDIDAQDGVDGNGVDPEDYYPLFIPVAGPFITIGTADTDRPASVLLVANGIAQSAGLAMFVAGLAVQQDVLVRIPTYGGVEVEMRPIVGKSFQGVGVTGSF